MTADLLKLVLDKYVNDLTKNKKPNEKGERLFANQLRTDIKSFTVMSLEGMLKEVGMYGTNTHTFSAANAFLIEFRGKV